MNKILTVGSLAFDSIRTPAGQAEAILGGSGNYFSIAASFYTQVQLIAIVGGDFPARHLEWLSSRGIDISGVKNVRDGKTFHWVGEYNQSLNEATTLSTALNVFEHFDPQLTEDQKNATHLFLANIDPILQKNVLEQCRAPRLIACDSMNFWIAGKPRELKETLKQVDILSINEGEAYLLAGTKNLLQAAQTIQDFGPQVVIIKRGEYGAALFSGTTIFLAPAFPVSHVADPTGAGDSFAGALMGYLAQNGVDRELAKQDSKEWNQYLRKAAIAGCAMASFTVEDFGLHRLMRLEKEELEERKNHLIEMITV